MKNSDKPEQRHRISGVDVAELILRTSIGATMIAHGIRHARSLDGTAGWFKSIGFRAPRIQATTSAGVEILAGSALVAGSLTPVAAAAVIGTMGVATRTVHAPNGFFITAEGYEYTASLAAACVALVGLPAGPLSLDRYFRTKRWRGSKAACATLFVGAFSSAIHTSMFWNNPRRRPQTTPSVTHLPEPAELVGEAR